MLMNVVSVVCGLWLLHSMVCALKNNSPHLLAFQMSAPRFACVSRRLPRAFAFDAACGSSAHESGEESGDGAVDCTGAIEVTRPNSAATHRIVVIIIISIIIILGSRRECRACEVESGRWGGGHTQAHRHTDTLALSFPKAHHVTPAHHHTTRLFITAPTHLQCRHVNVLPLIHLRRNSKVSWPKVAVGQNAR